MMNEDGEYNDEPKGCGYLVCESICSGGLNLDTCTNMPGLSCFRWLAELLKMEDKVDKMAL